MKELRVEDTPVELPTVPSWGYPADMASLSVPDHQLIRVIGRGSYGEVWLARNVLGTFRAIKIVRREAFSEDRPYEREFSGIQHFEPISRAHDGFVDILQVGRNDAQGHFYCVMELADAVPDPHGLPQSSPDWPNAYRPRTLEHEIKTRGRIPPLECIAWHQMLASALNRLHSQNLLHRDIKPANIIFVRGQPMFADIGLVADVAAAASFVGTEGFVPLDGPGTPTADIFSLGKVFYEALTGLDRLAFPSLPPDLIEGADSALVMELNAVLAKSCAPNASDRYPSTAELLDDLDLIHGGRSVLRVRTLEARLAQARRYASIAAILFSLAIVAALLQRRQTAREYQLRTRAEQAEQAQRRDLGQARLQEARALLQSHAPDKRLRALHALSLATGSAPAREVRNEVVAALALPAAPILPPQSTNSSPPVQAWTQDAENCLLPQGTNGLLLRSLQGAAPDAPVAFPTNVHPQVFLESASGRWRHVFQDNLWIGWLATNVSTQFQLVLEPGDAVEFHPDESKIGVWKSNGAFTLRSLPNLITLHSLSLHRNPGDFRFAPLDPEIVLFGGTSTLVDRVRLSDGKILASIDPGAPTHLCVWTPNGNTLAIASSDNRARIWPIAQRSFTSTLSGHQSQIIDLRFFPDSETLATGSWDSTTRFWDVATGRELLRLNESGAGFVANPRNRRFGWNRTNRSRAVLREFLPSSIVQTFRQPFSCVDVAFDPTETYLVAAGDRLRAVAILDGRELFSGGNPGTYRVWFDPHDRSLWASEWSRLSRYPLPPPSQSPALPREPESIPFTHSTKHPASFGPQSIALLDGPNVRIVGRTNVSWPHRQPSAETIALSPNGRWVATGTRNQRDFKVWDATTGQSLWDGRLGWGSQVVFSPDSQHLATTGSEETIVWHSQSGKIIWRLPALPDEIGHWHLDYSPDGQHLAVARTPFVVQVLEAKTGIELVTLQHPTPEYISEVRFSPSGRQLAVVCESGAIQVWNLEKLRRELESLHLDWPSPTPATGFNKPY